MSAASVGDVLAGLLRDLSAREGAAVFETLEICRIDETSCADAAGLVRLGDAARLVAAEGIGTLRVRPRSQTERASRLTRIMTAAA